MSKKYTAADFSREAWDTDGVRVVPLVPENTSVPKYPKQRALKSNSTVSVYREQRLSVLESEEVPYVIVDGYGQNPNGNTKMKTIRESYQKD